jgi:hypothetical protein
MNNQVILTDCDGVLLDWEWAFHVWMQERGYVLHENAKLQYNVHQMFRNLEHEESKRLIRTFNESAAIGFIPALRDAVYYVKKLHELHGYQFRVITSLSKDINAQKLREMNLKKLFGNAIESVVCLDTGADKDEVLAPYEWSSMWWIEDKPENSDVGYKLGLKSILVEHGHNMNHTCPYPIVKNWSEIYNLITG